MLVKLLLTVILIILTVVLIFSNVSSFTKNKHDNMEDVKELLNNKNIDEDELQYNSQKLNNKIKEQEEKRYDIPLTWNPNNTLESMITVPCLEDDTNVNRLTCFAAPEWWYPRDKYNENNFKSKYYRDSINPIYDYLGNAQDMFWDFKSVTGKVTGTDKL